MKRSRNALTVNVAAPLVLTLLAAAFARPADPGSAMAPPLARLEGSPEEIGKAHGRAFRAEIATLLPRYLQPLLALLGSDIAEMAGRARAMESFVPQRYRQEMKALAQAADLTYDEILVANTFLDLKEVPRCSTIAARGKATRDGEVLLGRNLDFPALGVAEAYTRLFAVHSTGYRSFVAVGWPGVCGVLSGINKDGLTLAVMEVYDGESTSAATPYAFLFRQILEECGSTDEAIAFLKKARITTSNNLMLADPSGRIVVAEIAPNEVFVREPTADVVYSCNHFQRDSEEVSPFYRRYRRLQAFARERGGTIDVPGVEKVLGEVAQSLLTVQSMVFLPRKLELHLAWGEVPATRSPYVRIDLKPLLR